MSEKKQTAVEWLIKELNLEGYDYTIQQAKEIEREQIKSAYVAGREDWYLDKYFSKHSEDYYNQTYKP